MERFWQERWSNDRLTSTRFHEDKILKPANLFEYARTFVEIQEIGAASQQYVLAIVDNLSCRWMLIRRSASAKVRASFEQLHTISRVGERTASSESGQTSACDCYSSLCLGRHAWKRRKKPLPSTLSFSVVVSRIFPLKTL